MYRNARIRDNLWTNVTWNLRDPRTWNRTNQWSNSEVLNLANAQLIQPVPATSNAVYQGGQTEGKGSPTRGSYGMLRAGFFDDRLLLLAGLRRNDLIQTVRRPVNSPQYGITGKVTRHVSLYASYSEAYIPNFGNRVIEGVIVGPQVPTVGKGYDFGAKIDLFEGRLSGAISYFSSQNTGAVVQTASFNNLGQLVVTSDQTGEQESSGIELDATIQLSRNWKTYLSYGRQDPKVKSQNDRPWMVGSALPDAPKDTAGLQTRYDIRQGSYKGLYFGGGATYTGTKVQRNSSSAKYPIGRDPVSGKIIDLPGFPKNGPAFEYKADPYTLVSLMAGYNFYRGKYGYNVQGNISNLFDEFYLPSNLSRGDGRRFSISFSVRH
jgi:outer membrane receptor protein involved in Fe transport